MDNFLRNLKKVVRTVLYRAVISQSDCGKAGPYQLPNNKWMKIFGWSFRVVIFVPIKLLTDIEMSSVADCHKKCLF